MPNTHTLKLFHARPNFGLSNEKTSIVEVVNEFNMKHQRAILEFGDYTTDAPSTPTTRVNVQQNIDPALLSSDIVVFTIGHQYGQGWTEKEYDAAVKSFKNTRSPRILCYFAHFEGKPTGEWTRFYEKCKNDGCQSHRYTDVTEFASRLKSDLETILYGRMRGVNTYEFGLLQPPIYFLSLSDRRRSLLRQLGFSENESVFLMPSEAQSVTGQMSLHEVEQKAQDNAALKIKVLINPSSISASRLTESIKANKLRQEDVIIVAADTLVHCGGRVQDSPNPHTNADIVGATPADWDAWRLTAQQMIQEQLHIGTYHVITGLAFCKLNSPWTISTVASRTEVHTQRGVDRNDIEAYLQHSDVLARAGAVTIDGQGVAFVHRIQGTFSNVAGLPLGSFAERLRTLFGVHLRPPECTKTDPLFRQPLTVLSIGDINYDLIYDGLETGELRSLVPPGLKKVGTIRRQVGGTAIQFAHQCRQVGFEKLVVGGIFGTDAPGEFIQRELENPSGTDASIPILAWPGRQSQTKTSIAIIVREKSASGEDASLTITNADQHLARDFAQHCPDMRNSDVVYVSGYALLDLGRQDAAIGALKCGIECKSITVVDLTVDFDKGWKYRRGTREETTFESFVDALDDAKPGTASTVVDILVSETKELIRWFAKEIGKEEEESQQLADLHAYDWQYVKQYIVPKLLRSFRVVILRTPKYTEQLTCRATEDLSKVSAQKLDYQSLPPHLRTGYGDKLTAQLVFDVAAPRVLLASGSVQRLLLLGQVFHPRQLLSYATGDTEEHVNGESVEQRVKRLARQKTQIALSALWRRDEYFVRAVAKSQNERSQLNPKLADNVEFIIAADTEAAWADGSIILPPDRNASIEEMFEALKRLRDSCDPHTMITGICIAGRSALDGKWKVVTSVVTTKVKWRSDTTDVDLWSYARTRDGVGKAGGYAIQGFAGCFVDEIVGSHSNVVGLPLEYICETLKKEFEIPIWTLDRNLSWRNSNPIIKLTSEPEL